MRLIRLDCNDEEDKKDEETILALAEYTPVRRETLLDVFQNGPNSGYFEPGGDMHIG